MKRLVSLAGVFLFCAGLHGAEPRSCAGAVSLQEFRLIAVSSRTGETLSLIKVNALRPGDKLTYQPARSKADTKAKVAVILAPAEDETSDDLAVLDARPAGKAAQWTVPFRPSIVAVVFGPEGLDVKKVNSLVSRNEHLISQLADYAEQTARVGALIDTLAAWEQSPTKQNNLNAFLNGFSSQYGVSVPKLDPSSPADQQAALLLRAVLPPLSRYDPLTTQSSARWQQSAGLAATVASLFFGSPVVLAAGGAALFQNLRTLMFPDTDFRSAFAQSRKADEVALCSEQPRGKSRTRSAYLWALRLPACGPPSVSLESDSHLPIGWKAPVKVKLGDPAQLRLLPRVQSWHLLSDSGETHPVSVAAAASTGALEFDLTKAAPAAGTYRLAGTWDWDRFEVAGRLHLHEISNAAAIRISEASEDRLVAGTGVVPVQLEGTDFQFVEKLALVRTDRRGLPAADVPFTLPLGKSAGPQYSLETEVDTSAIPAGTYRLRITQVNEKEHEIPLTVHPPLPAIANLPLRVNVGETEQKLRLRGSGLDRIERITGGEADWELGPVTSTPGASEREAKVRLHANARKGDRLDIRVAVRGLHQPIGVPAALEIAGPRPRILAADRSLASVMAVELRDGEIPAGLPVTFSISVVNLDSRAALELTCGGNPDAKPALVLRPGEVREAARVDFAGEGALFLSLDPRTLGSAGCDLTAAVTTEAAGRSDPYRLGHLVRVPEIEKFELTDERVQESCFVGILTGTDLHTVEKTGWDAHHGFPVLGIPKPVVREPGKQTLRVALPWPAPTPRAPIFVWLRGEAEGRPTRARF